MLLLAWSFVLNAVEYAKRKQISRIIWRFMEEARLFNGEAGLICRYTPETVGRSENKSQWLFDMLNGTEAERCVYRSEAYQLLVIYKKMVPQEDVWLHQPSYWNDDMRYSKDRMSFFVKLSLQPRRKHRGNNFEKKSPTLNRNADDDDNYDRIEVEDYVLRSEEPMSAEAMCNLDDVAHLIAQHRRNCHLFHYESTLEAFCEIVFQWMEGKLYRCGVLIDEIYTVDLPPTISIYSRQQPDLESEALSASSTLSTSHLSLASSSGSNVSEEPPYSLLEMLYLKELLGTKMSAQFVSARCLNMPLGSTFNKPLLTCDVIPLRLDDEKLSTSSAVFHPYNHLSLRRKGNSDSYDGGGKRSLSLIRRCVDSADDFSGRPNVASTSAQPLRDISDGILTYLSCLRLKDKNDVNYQYSDAVSLSSGGSQMNDISLKSATQSDILNDNKNGALSSTSSNSFHDDDLRSVLDFNVPITSTIDSSFATKSHNDIMTEIMPSPASSKTITPIESIDETPRVSLVNIPECDSIDVRDSSTNCLNNVAAVEHATQEIDSQRAVRHYRYVPTAEFSRRSSQNVESTAKSKVIGRRHLSSMEAILERYSRSVAITHFNVNYELPKYCGGWQSSREKIAHYHQFTLRRRLFSLIGDGHENALLLFRRFVEMNLRSEKDGLYSSSVCLNRRSTSLEADRMTYVDVFDRVAVRMSAMRKRRCHSFPRHFFHGDQVTQNNKSKQTPMNSVDVTTNSESIGSQPKKFVKSSAKPPSILVYTGDHKELYAEIENSLRAILSSDTYAVRDLTTRALKFHPWSHEQCVCLIVAGMDQLDDSACAQLQQYFKNYGKMLFVCENALLADLTSCGFIKKQVALLKNVFERKAASDAFGKEFESFLKKSLHQLTKTNEINEGFHAKDTVGGCQIVLCKKAGQPFLLYMQTSENHRVRSCALFSDATTNELLRNSELVADALSRLGINSKAPSDDLTAARALSVGYMLCQQDKLILDVQGMTYGKLFDANLGLMFQNNSRRDDEYELLQPSASCLPILVCRRSEPPKELSDHFDHSAYFDNLKTKTLGRMLLYVPVCTTTIDIAKSFATLFPNADGLLISGGYQLRGRGRSGNAWLSPRGCATLQFNFNVPTDSELGQSITFVQHVVAVAIVDAIVTQVRDEKFPIKIKWPNDIYYKRDFKLGGVLVTASHRGSQFECNIGAGVNISNAKPTVCVNNFLTAGKSLTVEKFLAEVMNKFEHYVQLFTNEGKAAFIQQYVRHWMHSDEEVVIVHEEGEAREHVIVQSLDADGFLFVQSKRTGLLFSVRDDGNSFDIMHGLIHPKD